MPLPRLTLVLVPLVLDDVDVDVDDDTPLFGAVLWELGLGLF